MGNKNSSSKSKVRGQATKVSSTEPQHVPKYEKSSTEQGQYGIKGSTNTTTIASNALEQQCKGPLDNDDTFNNFIRRAKRKIRTVTMSKSIADSKHGNVAASAPAPAPAPDKAYGTINSNNKDNQRDQFSEFIQLAKKKLRTTSSIGNNGSLKRG